MISNAAAHDRPRLSVIGLGKLGSPLAAVLAKKGFEVVGLDLNPQYVATINAGQAPVDEPLLQLLLDQNKDRIRATTDYDDAVLNSDISFIIVPTPSGSNGFFSNRHVIAAVESIGAALRGKSAYHLVVVTSTVMPGSTGGEIKNALERSSGRQVGDTVGLCYNPEFIALGSVVNDLLLPDFILIGEGDDRSGTLLADIYAQVCDNNPAVLRMNFVNAELCKISVNTFVTTKISYANMLAEMCDNLPDADVDVVTNALGSDSRIGRKYLKGAVGYGGPCFPRDNKAFAALGRSLGVRCDIAEATDAINVHQIERFQAVVASRCKRGDPIGILGLSYKPGTGVIEESHGFALALALSNDGYTVYVFDPVALPSASAVLGKRVIATVSAAECASRSKLIIIATPWPEFASLNLSALCNGTERKTIIDPWRCLQTKSLEEVAEVIHLGTGGWKNQADRAVPSMRTA
jgi:UDPglucose 6-dehydrogenase